MLNSLNKTICAASGFSFGNYTGFKLFTEGVECCSENFGIKWQLANLKGDFGSRRSDLGDEGELQRNGKGNI